MPMILTQDNYHDIGAFLAARRQLLGLEQKEIAERIGTAKATISAIEIGRNGARLSTIFLICDTMGLEIEIREKNGSKPD